MLQGKRTTPLKQFSTIPPSRQGVGSEVQVAVHRRLPTDVPGAGANLSSIVDESGPATSEAEGMAIPTDLILASLERDEGPTSADCEAGNPEACHPCDDDANGRLGYDDCGGGSGNVKLILSLVVSCTLVKLDFICFINCMARL